ncbi:hypothetical protein [Streptomyces sp. NPDC002054]|uniref:hypothetical protein n=1 Tax=Streptomyces sp. NPDC002054 TaxID=3154663 RepID=UPI003321F4EA
MGSASRVGRRAWLASGVALPLVLALAGFSAPAMAADLSPSSNHGSCDTTRADKPAKSVKGAKAGKAVKRAKAGPENNNSGGCRGPRGPKGPRGERGPAGPPGPCADIDSTEGEGDVEFSAVLSKGKAYLGRRSVAPVGQYTWRDLTTYQNPGFPKEACSVSVSTEGRIVYVKVLTTGGDVYENYCTYALSCPSGWTALAKP